MLYCFPVVRFDLKIHLLSRQMPVRKCCMSQHNCLDSTGLQVWNHWVVVSTIHSDSLSEPYRGCCSANVLDLCECACCSRNVLDFSVERCDIYERKHRSAECDWLQLLKGNSIRVTWHSKCGHNNSWCGFVLEIPAGRGQLCFFEPHKSIWDRFSK